MYRVFKKSVPNPPSSGAVYYSEVSTYPKSVSSVYISRDIRYRSKELLIFKLRYFGTLEPGILKLDIFLFINSSDLSINSSDYGKLN